MLHMLLKNQQQPNPSLVELIGIIKTTSNDDQLRTLHTQFYQRLANKFFGRCTTVVRKLLSNAPAWEHVRDDIYQETFITALEELKRFKLQNHWEDHECEKVLLFWLGRIANNKILNLLKDNKRGRKAVEEFQRMMDIENSEGDTISRKIPPSYEKCKFDKVWSGFNPMTKEIILACLAYDTIRDGNTSHLPDEEIEAITKKYNVKPAAVRKAKQRGIEAIKRCKIE
jgi:DNA-directed RNA polymerase specialized sigma24 family protein